MNSRASTCLGPAQPRMHRLLQMGRGYDESFKLSVGKQPFCLTCIIPL